MRWVVHGERPVYESTWMTTVLTDVEIPTSPGPDHPGGGHGPSRFEHHVVRFPVPAAGVVVHDDRPGLGPAVLLLWRHRFITDRWGWEVPAGRVDEGETAAAAAARETLEETGWVPGPLTHLTSYAPASGVSDLRFELFAAAGATHVGDPADPSESDHIAWVPVRDLPDLMGAGHVDNGLTLTALAWCLALGVIAP